MSLGGEHGRLPDVVERIHQACFSKRRSAASIERCISQDSTQHAELAVLANSEDGEAISGAQVLARMLHEQMQEPIMEVLVPEEVKVERRPTVLVVSLTKGAFCSDTFAKTVVAASKIWPTAVMITVRSPDFQFPLREVLERSVYPTLAASTGLSVQEIIGSFAPIMTSLALPFFPSGRASLVCAEVTAVSGRIKRLAKKRP